MTGTVAFILKGYPRLSETFIAQEIRALEERGLRILIVSLRQPTDRARHPVHAEIEAPLLYLPEYLWRQPRRVWRAWRALRRWPAYRAARAVWWRDLRRERTSNRIRRFGQALVLAHELGAEVRHLHAHFLHTPASVTRYAAMLRDLPWSVSAHAKDVWTTPEWEKREKLSDCAWLVTCTAVNREHLAALGAPDKVDLVYHGLDMARFAVPPKRPPRGAGEQVVILSVGRAVEKKGYDDLLRALANLPDDLDWRFIHIGGGERLRDLKTRARRLGLSGRIEWRGAQPQGVVLAAYREADIFVLASRIAKSGDRDGLPNVLMEAQSQELACLSTRVSAIPELIEDGKTGRLVAPGDVHALSAALASLIRDPSERARFGQAGAARVRQSYGMGRGIDQLAAKFGLDRRQAAE
ncbi:MAG: glycosyltransferase family 4 protein [Proteobacteria bacterium]|nr:glycosyltransferase family 4 protein [Pseudomonadota bacterium]